MCYKNELQKKNEEILKRRFKEDHFPEFLQDFFMNLNSSAGKITYYSTIKDMLNWFIESGNIDKKSIAELTKSDMNSLDKTDMNKYFEHLEDIGIKPSTINTKKNMLSSLWKHLVDVDICSKNIVRLITKSKYKIRKKNNAKVPLHEDLVEMEQKMAAKKDPFVRERNLIILRVLKGTGLRETELAGLDLQDLHLEDIHPYITVIGKGTYYECDADKVYITKNAKEAFEEWLEIRKGLDIDTHAVFVNSNGKRLNEGNIKAIFRNYSDGKITPHMIRHLYATLLYKESGHNSVFVQEQLRHKSIDTSMGTYTSGQTEDNYKLLEKL